MKRIRISDKCSLLPKAMGENRMPKMIYIADDEKNIRDLISLFLTNEGYIVRTFQTGDELLACFNRDPCDLIILDVMMPGTDGFELSSIMRKQSNVPIIIVSARDSEMDKITGISLGSDDYLTKPFSPLELVARVRAIFRRLQLDGGNHDHAQLRFANIELEVTSRDFIVDGKKVDLSPTEFTLMEYLINHHSKAISREELLKNVWKFDFEADTRATDDVIKRLRKKLIQAGSTAKIESVWGFGFKLEELVS